MPSVRCALAATVAVTFLTAAAVGVLAGTAQAAPEVLTYDLRMRGEVISTGLVAELGGPLTVTVGSVPDECVALGPGNFEQWLALSIGGVAWRPQPPFDSTETRTLTTAGEVLVGPFNGTIAGEGGEACIAARTPVTLTSTPPMKDTAAPTLQLPGAQTVNATSRAGAQVTYPTPVGAADPDTATEDLTVSCTPGTLTGGSFGIGTTTVQCTAANPAGNSSSGTITVTVLGAAEQLADLRDAVQGVGPGNSLNAKIRAAQTALQAGHQSGACSTLGDFIAQVRAQSGKKIPAAQAQQLTATANRIRAVIGCG